MRLSLGPSFALIKRREHLKIYDDGLIWNCLNTLKLHYLSSRFIKSILTRMNGITRTTWLRRHRSNRSLFIRKLQPCSYLVWLRMQELQPLEHVSVFISSCTFDVTLFLGMVEIILRRLGWAYNFFITTWMETI